MAGPAITAFEWSVYRLFEQSTLRRGVWLMALMTRSPLYRIPLMGGNKRSVGLVTPRTNACSVLVE
jgi:hypothetical protein